MYNEQARGDGAEEKRLEMIGEELEEPDAKQNPSSSYTLRNVKGNGQCS